MSSVKQILIESAQKYETADFLTKDPSQFMHNYKTKEDMETAAFISANLAFGRRDQILKHVQLILDLASPSPYQWIKNGKYKEHFKNENRSFYRMYTYSDMLIFFDTFQNIIKKDQTLGLHWKKKYSENPHQELCFTIADDFPADCGLIPHSKDSACKKINMFLRWMVRKNSPVDLGLWADWYPEEKLLIPMDTHVIQQAAALGLLPLTKTGKPASANIKNCRKLTEILNSIFPKDPCKADYALFGLGVNS